MNDDTTIENSGKCYGCGEIFESTSTDLTFHDCPNGWWGGGPDLLNPGYTLSGRKL